MRRKCLTSFLLLLCLLCVPMLSVEAAGKKQHKQVKKQELSLSLKGTKKTTLKAPMKKGYKVKKVSYRLSKKGVVAVKKKGKILKVTAKKKGTVQLKETIQYKKRKKKKTVKIIYKIRITKEDEDPYSYSVTPLLPPFNRYFYVKTDNPNPNSFYFVDKDSKYSDEPTILMRTSIRFHDVVYENKYTGRVSGGYIFENYNRGNTDGGTWTVMSQKAVDPTGKQWQPHVIEVMCPLKSDKDTGKTVECPEVKTTTDYLLDTYTNASMSFFEKLDAVQTAVDQLGLYPQTVVGAGTTSTTPYPMLLSTIYPERSLDEIYKTMFTRNGGDYMFLQQLYPFVLDSYSEPRLMAAVAKKLDPNCEIEPVPNIHWLFNISKDGVKKPYGGAGRNSFRAQELQSNRIESLFFFDGRAGDYACNVTMQQLEAKWEQYRTLADEDEKYYKDMMANAKRDAVQYSSWIRVASAKTAEPQYAYMTKGTHEWDSIYLLEDMYQPLTDTWVDGRYINEYEVYVPGARWEDHPTSDIVVRDMQYTDLSGTNRTADVTFRYDATTDTWRAERDYVAGAWVTIQTKYTVPDYMILTREEIKEMQIDRNTNVKPTGVLIFDGTVYPGTKE